MIILLYACLKVFARIKIDSNMITKRTSFKLIANIKMCQDRCKQKPDIDFILNTIFYISLTLVSCIQDFCKV